MVHPDPQEFWALADLAHRRELGRLVVERVRVLPARRGARFDPSRVKIGIPLLETVPKVVRIHSCEGSVFPPSPVSTTPLLAAPRTASIAQVAQTERISRHRRLLASRSRPVGRVGAVPTRRTLVAVWGGAAVAFGLLLAVAEWSREPLDDPDPARQRPGVLDLGDLPAPAPQLTAGIPAPGRRAVVFFARPADLERLCRALEDAQLADDVDVVVVVSANGRGCPSGTPTLVDPTGTYARRFGLQAPRDGGAPAGYALVDSAGRIRYRTLDPHLAQGLEEVRTIVAATP